MSARHLSLRHALLLAAAFAACSGRDAARAAGITVSRAYYVLPAGTSPGALYFTMANSGPSPDTLTAIASSAGSLVMIHGPMPAMAPVGAIEIAAGATERLAPGVRHGMVSAPSPTIHAGDSVSVTLTFARAGTRTVRAAAITYADVDTATATATAAAAATATATAAPAAPQE